MADRPGDAHMVSLLRSLDEPVAPPAGFAERLFAELMAEAPTDALPAPGAAVRTLDPDVVGRPVPVRPSRRVPSRWAAAAAGFAAVALLAALTLVIRPAGDTPSDTPTTSPSALDPTSTPTNQPGSLVTHVDPDGRFTVSYPDSWILADEPLTPSAGVGPDVFAVGTFGLPGTSTGCPQQPTTALEEMGPNDAMVWVEEHQGTSTNAPRQGSFPPLLDRVDEDTDTYQCMEPSEQGDLGVLRWITFTDAGSDFYAVVAVGRDAPEAVVAQAAAVIDSFSPSILIGQHVADLGWDGERIWMIGQAWSPRSGTPPPDHGTVFFVDPDSGQLHQGDRLTDTPLLVAGDDEAVWAAHDATGNLTRIDPTTGRVEGEVQLELPFDAYPGDERRRFIPDALVVEDGVAWVLSAQGALAEVRDNGEEVIVHVVRVEAQPESLEVVGDTAWVEAAGTVLRVSAGSDSSVQVSLDHYAQRLGTDGSNLVAAGDVPGEEFGVTTIDPETGAILNSTRVSGTLTGIVTIDGRFGALETTGLLHTVDGSGETWQTDLAAPGATVQAGDELWSVTGDGRALRQVRLTGPAPPASPDTPPSTPTTSPGSLVTHIDPDDRFTVRYPQSWILADAPLTPGGGVGPDLFAVGTFDLPATSTNCPYPTTALEDMGPDDAMVWVEERLGTTGNAPRPRTFEGLLDRVDEDTAFYQCMEPSEQGDLGVLRWIDFTDTGSDFYAVVAVGRDAPSTVVAQAAAVLDSFSPSVLIGGGLQVDHMGWDGERMWMVGRVPVESGAPPPDRATVMSFDIESGERVTSTELTGSPSLVAGDGDAVWVAHGGTGNLTRLDPTTGMIEAEVAIELPFDFGTTNEDRRRFIPSALVVEDGVAWVLTARGALAEVRDGGDEVIVHVLDPENPGFSLPHSMQVVDGTVWVDAFQTVRTVADQTGTSLTVELDHYVHRLGTDGVNLVGGGEFSGEESGVTTIHAETGAIVDRLRVPGNLVGIVTVDGRFGALDTTGLLHTVDGSGETWQTDLGAPGGTVQAGDELWKVPHDGVGLRRIRIIGSGPMAIPIEIPDGAQARSITPDMATSADWVMADPSPHGGRTLARLRVWTGTELVLWGLQPVAETALLADPVAYNPQTNTWRAVAPAPIALGVHDTSGLWTGGELVMWTTEEAAAWNPATDSWRVTSDWPLQPRPEQHAVWTGDEIIDIHAGLAVDPTTGAFRPIAPAPDIDEESTVVWADGTIVVVPEDFVYNLDEDRWISRPSRLLSASADGVWTGNEVFVADSLGNTASYDPVADSWSSFNASVPGRHRCRPQVGVLAGRPLVMTCDSVVIWDPTGSQWLPVALPGVAGGTTGTTVSTSGEVVFAWADGDLYRLDETVLTEGPRRLAVGASVLDLPQGWSVGTVRGREQGTIDVVVEMTLHGPEGAVCRVRAFDGEATEALRPFLTPGHEVVEFEHTVGGKPVEALSLPADTYDEYHHLVWATSPSAVIDVGCNDGSATDEIARNLWSPWQ